MADILVVDDDRKTVDLIRLYLERAGFGVRVAHDGERALELVGECAPDLLILDLMLPKIDGLDVCLAVQAVNPVPVIMLTARTTEGDKLAGLETGADGEPSEVRSGDLVIDLLHHDGDYSPWEGWQVRGWPATTILRGTVVVEEGELRAEPGVGTFIPRQLDPEVLAGPAF